MIDKLKSFLLFVFTLSEFRWWLWRAKTQLLDEEVEKYHLRALALQIGEVVGVSAVVTIILFNLAAGSALGDVPVVELALPDTTADIKVIAREPGVAFDVLLFCNDPTTTVGKTALTDAPAGGTRYIALRGTESVNWADSPEGKNPSAMHYVTAPDGRQNGEAVEVSKAASDCLKKKAPK